MSFGFGRRRGTARIIKQGSTGQGRGAGGCGHGGPPTNCICPQCGLVVPREPGVPCFQKKCPQCGSSMARQFLKIE
jgi:hypothetical protein